MSMRALFYSPYLDSLGGGERYVLTLVEGLLSIDWEVDILWDGETVTEPVKSKFGVDVSGANYLGKGHMNIEDENPWVEIKRKRELMRGYDLIFWLSDGSVPLLFGKKNIVHFQSPFQNINGGSWLNWVKKRFIDEVVVNSEFTKQFIDREFALNSKVIYPPVSVNEIVKGKKVNAILYVGRFSNLMQMKGQSLSIKYFKELCNTGVKNYELWLAGSTGVGTGDLLENLKSEVGNYPVKFFVDVEWDILKDLYSQAKFFWSATGYEADESIEPEKCEHFGMSLVEAMAGGCVPLVVNKGGYKEIITSGLNGVLWNSGEEWLNETTRLMNDENKFQNFSQEAVRRASEFSQQVFMSKFMDII